MSELTLQVESFKRVDLIKASGRIDSVSALELDKTFENLAEDSRYNIVLDLSDISYISSAGLRAMVSASRASKKNGGAVRIATPSDAVLSVFGLAGVTPLFETYETVVSAVGSY